MDLHMYVFECVHVSVSVHVCGVHVCVWSACVCRVYVVCVHMCGLNMGNVSCHGVWCTDGLHGLLMRHLAGRTSGLLIRHMAFWCSV